MESVLIVITLVSLALTIALAVVLARLMRDERRRSEARAAVLREMADAVAREQLLEEPGDELDLPLVADVQPAGDLFVHREPGSAWRSEARRVGKECTSVCRSRWSPYH